MCLIIRNQLKVNLRMWIELVEYNLIAIAGCCSRFRDGKTANSYLSVEYRQECRDERVTYNIVWSEASKSFVGDHK